MNNVTSVSIFSLTNLWTWPESMNIDLIAIWLVDKGLAKIWTPSKETSPYLDSFIRFPKIWTSSFVGIIRILDLSSLTIYWSSKSKTLTFIAYFMVEPGAISISFEMSIESLTG